MVTPEAGRPPPPLATPLRYSVISLQIAIEALTKHKETLGKRYVEIFKSTAAEVQQVFTVQYVTEAQSSDSFQRLITWV